MIACRVHPDGDCPKRSTACAYYFTNVERVPVGPGRLTLTDGSVIETGSGYATLNPTPRTETFAVRLDIDPGTARLLEALRTPEPARVKVKPLGSTFCTGFGVRRLRCRAGWWARCTECGDLETYGVSFLTVALNIARTHLKREHAA